MIGDHGRSGSSARGCMALLALVAASPALADEAGARPDRPGRVDVNNVRVVQTSSDLSQRLTRLADKRFGSRVKRGSRVIRVDDHRRYQRITGFGAALTDTAAWLLHEQLSAPVRAAVMRRLYGARGIRLGFVRVPMGASDFTHDGIAYSALLVVWG